MNYKISPSAGAASAVGSDASSPAALFSDNFLLIDAKLSRTVIRKHPLILLYSALTFLVCFSAGCAAVYYSGEVEEDARRHAVSVGPSADLENSIRSEFESLSSGTRQLASYVKFNANCSILDKEAEPFMAEVLHWDPRISSLSILPSFVFKYRYPQRTTVIGTDMLVQNNADAKEQIQRDGLWFTTPAYKPNCGIIGSFATYSIWLPAESNDVDLGTCILLPAFYSY